MKMTNNQYRGVVYVDTLNAPNSDENGFKYVGVTLDEPERRRKWKNVNTKNYGGQRITDARAKYGLQSFSYQVLEVHYGDDEKKLRKFLKDDRETYFIKEFDSVNQGFNESRGGTGHKGRIFSEIHRARIGAKSKGRKHTEATKAIISQKLKGHEMAPEIRAKISQRLTGKKRTAE